ncbi:MAG: CBS domain-containing protein [Pseudomonadales bacterium]|nr:CBS domain-containing protein [Pseudomonadales bacterium]
MTFTVYGLAGHEHLPIESIKPKFKVKELQPSQKIRPVSRKDDKHHQNKQYPADLYNKVSRMNSELTVENIMSKPVITLATDSTIRQATQIFSIKMYRHIPIVNHEGKLVSIVSDRDVLLALSQPGDKNRIWNQALIELSARKVVATDISTRIPSAAQALFDAHIGALPVVNAHQEVIGIVTRSDLLMAIVSNQHLVLDV